MRSRSGSKASRGSTRRTATRFSVSRPDLGPRERRHLLDAFDAGAISSVGPHVAAFEALFARAIGVPHAVAVSNGTAALHLALCALRIGPGDEVIVPDLTFIAPANTVAYTGASVVLADVDAKSWTLDPAAVERALTKRTRAIVAVHLYGVPADLDALRRIARRRGVALIEDAAEALGSTWRGRPVGGFGALGCFSLFGNKTITTGEGGVVTTRSAAHARRVRLLRDHGMSRTRRYYHPEIGFNYRMTALQAAVGVGQLERLPDLLARRRRVAAWYADELRDVAGLVAPTSDGPASVVPWLYTVALRGVTPARRDAVMARLAKQGIETRPVFLPLSTLPPHRAARRPGGTPVARRIARSALSLPTYAALQRGDVAEIASALRRALAAPRTPAFDDGHPH